MKTKKVIAITLACAMVLSGTENLFTSKNAMAASDYNLNNPTTDSNGVSTWDCIYFGNYWQDDTNGDGTADRNDEKKPIKWRVLSVNGDDAFILADKNLDAKAYNEIWTEITWENSTIRSWLNGYGASSNESEKDFTDDNFFNNAFSASEQNAIRTTNVVNEDNPNWGTKGGNDTEDKVYLLSISEASNAAYGFNSKFDTESETRKAKNTAYTASKSRMNSAGSTDFWWLRTPGGSSWNASSVADDGCGNYHWDSVDSTHDAVRPAMHINLSSSNLWSCAGTVSSDDSSQPTGTPTKTPSKAVKVKKGTVIKDKKTKASYKVLSVKTGALTVEYLKPTNKNIKSVSMKTYITYGGKKYKIVKIAVKAFMNCKKLIKVTVGKNVRTIGKKAFANCKALKTVQIPKGLKKSKIPKNEFTGCRKKPKIKVFK